MAEQQSAADVLMIRPASFCANTQTAESNRFQNLPDSPSNPQTLAVAEFDGLAKALIAAGVRIHVFEDTLVPSKPDALFPNNWVSFHADGTAVLYPMLAKNRRLERRPDILEILSRQYEFRIDHIHDLVHHEADSKFLEGTGSMVLDRINHVAYACLSPRTDFDLLGEFAQRLDYEIVAFEAHDSIGMPIYHTNVMLSIGTAYAVVCTEAIRADQRRGVLDALRATNHRLVEIRAVQMNDFTGNVLELSTIAGGHVLALSDRAASALDEAQVSRLREWCGPFVTAPIPIIETLGGGSVRCMLAEIHLPLKA